MDYRFSFCKWRKLPLADRDGFIHQCYVNNKTDYRNVMGYKGGNLERDVLNRLNIPNYNIENDGGPKFDVLIKDTRYPQCYPCPSHQNMEMKLYCPLVETFYFGQYLQSVMDPKYFIIQSELLKYHKFGY